MLSAERKCFHGQTKFEFSSKLSICGGNLRRIRSTLSKLRKHHKSLMRQNAPGFAIAENTESIKLAEADYKKAWAELRNTQMSTKTKERNS